MKQVYINLIENKNLVENLKKNALNFSNTVFFQEDKLLELLNNRLEKMLKAPKFWYYNKDSLPIKFIISTLLSF